MDILNRPSSVDGFTCICQLRFTNKNKDTERLQLFSITDDLTIEKQKK